MDIEESHVQQGYVGLIEAYGKYDYKKIIWIFWSYTRKFVKGRMVEFTIQHFNYKTEQKKINKRLVQYLL